MIYYGFWKKVYRRTLGRLSWFCGGVKMGKKSYIDPHGDILNGKFISLGDLSHINDHCWLQCYTALGRPSLIIGKNTIIGRNFTALCCKSIIIGDNCMIASFVMISDVNHSIDLCKGSYISQGLVAKEVIIGNNVWIGQNSIILSGVSIGDNCVIGAGAVVTKSIPPNSLAVGNPAKVIKEYDFFKQKWISVKENNYDK